MPQLIPFSLTHMNLFQMCSRACQDYTSVSLLAESLLSPPTSPTPRETGGVDGAEMDEEQFFFFFSQGVMEGQKEARGTKLRRWKKSENAKMETDRETLSWLWVNTHSRSVGVKAESCCRAHYKMTLTRPDLLRWFIWQKSGLCIFISFLPSIPLPWNIKTSYMAAP